VVKAPARLDWAKLNHINNQHLRKADDARLAALTVEALERQGVTVLSDMHDRLRRTVGLVKEGCATIVELAAASQFALAVRPFTFDDKTVKLLTDETRERLGRLRQALAGVAAWEQPILEEALKSFAESEGVGLGKFGPALRGVLSGGHPAPDLASTLAALGPEEGLARIDDALCAAQ
jgi:glutamyl-tRNA synthetase